LFQIRYIFFVGILVDEKLTSELREDFWNILPLTLMYKDTALDVDAVSKQIDAFYLNSQPVGNASLTGLTNLFSDRYFTHCTRRAALLHSRIHEGKPVYMYLFTYRGKQSQLKFLDVENTIGKKMQQNIRVFEKKLISSLF